MPTVRTIRQPPTQVPNVSEVVATTVTQIGALVPVECCVATSITTMTPGRLRRVVRAVTEREAGRADPLAPPDRTVDLAASRGAARSVRTRVPTNPVSEAERRREHEGEQDEADGGPAHRVEPVGDHRGADESADERVRGARGRPRHHDKRFQTSAPLTPAPMTATTWSAGTSTIFPTVSATAAPSSSGPSRVNTAATASAGPGIAVRVATSVATASAASCTPFVKLNAVAAMIAASSPPATRAV